MPSHSDLITSLGLVALLAPALLMSILGIASLLDRPPREETTGKVCQATIIAGMLASVLVLMLMLWAGTRHESIQVVEWVAIPHYHFSLKLIFDRLSVPMLILSYALCGTIAAFATRYLHREPGFNRFFTLFSFFVMGMVLTAVAGTIETLFAGWELVGLSSALLVAFFQERPAPPRNGLRVWVVYRVSDAALLLAAIVMHHLKGAGDFDKLLGGPWPAGRSAAPEESALIVGGLILFAAMGKSALAPFSGWLPRAMEGPTPSSAIFYGALSVHLGAFLLRRFGSVLEASAWLSGAVVLVGPAPALHAYVVGSVQADIKSALAYASLVQVGLIVAEIGLGLRYIALIHMLGNACLRTLQFLRAPAILQDYRVLEDAIGMRLSEGKPTPNPAPGTWRARLYRFALERGYLDAFLARCCVDPVLKFFRWTDQLEKRWTDYLAGRASREMDTNSESSNSMGDLT